MMQRILFSVVVWCTALGLGTAWAVPPRAHMQLPAVLEPVKGLAVGLERRGAEVIALLPGGKTQSLGVLEDDESRRGAAPVLQADFNFDGAQDLAVCHGVSGDKGEIQMYRMLFWNRKTGRFDVFEHILGSPVTEPSRLALVATMHDGNHWLSSEYRVIGRDFRLAVGRVHDVLPGIDLLRELNADGDVLRSRLVAGSRSTLARPETEPLARAAVQTAKAVLYDEPDGPDAKGGKRSGMYLVKGDRVTLIGHANGAGEALPNGEPRWYRVRFEGSRRVEKWLPADDLRPR